MPDTASKINFWEKWPSFPALAKGKTGPDFAKSKQAVIDEFGTDALNQAWVKTCQALEGVTREICEKSSACIPQISFQEALNMSEGSKQRIKAAGCLVVRGVFSEEEATDLYHDIKQYWAENPGIQGWPEDNPSVYRLYYSPTQVRARTHPHQLQLQKALNELWRDDSSRSSSDPLLYSDAIRVRPPGQPFIGLGPHIDAGSLSRWADPTYREVYREIFSGFPERFDPYDMTKRQDAVQELFPGSAHSSVFRSWQGWTALTETGPFEGSILLYPRVAVPIAYVLLRPFFRAPGNGSLDPKDWEFDASSDHFPGTIASDSQMLSPESHPHLRLKECLSHIPKMSAGDTIWWHCDVSI